MEGVVHTVYFINGMTVTGNGTVHETEDRTLLNNYFVHKIISTPHSESQSNVHMPEIAAFCLAFFLVAIGLVEYLDRRSLNPARTWISSYITDAPLSWLEDLGFVTLAASMELMPHIFKAGLAQTVALSAAGIAALLVVASRKYFPAWFPSLSSTTITRIHVLSAGIAFLGAFGGILAGSDVAVKIVLGLTVFVCSLVLTTTSPVKDQTIEKALAVGICLAGLVRLISLVR